MWYRECTPLCRETQTTMGLWSTLCYCLWHSSYRFSHYPQSACNSRLIIGCFNVLIFHTYIHDFWRKDLIWNKSSQCWRLTGGTEEGQNLASLVSLQGLGKTCIVAMSPPYYSAFHYSEVIFSFLDYWFYIPCKYRCAFPEQLLLKPHLPLACSLCINKVTLQ